MSKFQPIRGFKWIYPNEFDLNKYTSASAKVCVWEVDLEYHKELHQLHDDHPLVPDKIEIKEKILSSYQLKVADFYNIPIGNFKKLVPNFFDKGKHVLHYENLQLYLRLGLKQKNIYHVLEFYQSEWLNPYVQCNTTKRIEAETNGDKNGSVVQVNEQHCVL